MHLPSGYVKQKKMFNEPNKEKEMNRTFTFKVDKTIPQLDAIIEDNMDDFAVAKKARRLHIDTDYLPVVVSLDPDNKPERWAPQNHNWRVVDTLFNVRLIDQSMRLVLAYTQDDDGNHVFLIDRLREVDNHPLIKAYPAIRPMLGSVGRDYRWDLSFGGENHLERFAKTMRQLGLSWATEYDADMGHLSGTSFALYGAETLTEFEGTCELIFKRNYKAILADVLQKRATYEELVQGLESRGVNIEFTKLTGEVNAVMYHEGIAGTEERIEGACAMYNRFGKFTDCYGTSGVIVDVE